ncbi:MAG: PIN domain nuclease [Thermoleophilia bacterium]|nr:PIN domain nuclease [Thermoleophilia bacterium]
MRTLLDTSILIGAESPGDLEGAISAASLAELHLGLLVARSEEERARRSQRLGVIEATFDPCRSTPLWHGSGAARRSRRQPRR